MEDLRKINAIFNDCYKLYKSFCSLQLTDDEIMQAIVETEKIRKKYNCEIANDILIAVMNEIDRIATATRKNM